MPNVNCLENIKCPNCDQEYRFFILSTVTAIVTDHGAEAADGNFQWRHESHIECRQCGHTGKVDDFTLKTYHVTVNRIVIETWEIEAFDSHAAEQDYACGSLKEVDDEHGGAEVTAIEEI
jgi:hypothetical protein